MSEQSPIQSSVGVFVEWAKAHGLGSSTLEELAAHPEVHALIEAEIAQRNRELASFESVKKFHILPRDLSIEHGEMTASLKVKRRVVYDKYAHLFEELYAGEQ